MGVEVQPEYDAESESVMGQRSITKDGTMVQKSLIKWKGRSVENVTWEEDATIRSRFPEFKLIV